MEAHDRKLSQGWLNAFDDFSDRLGEWLSLCEISLRSLYIALYIDATTHNSFGILTLASQDCYLCFIPIKTSLLDSALAFLSVMQVRSQSRFPSYFSIIHQYLQLIPVILTVFSESSRKILDYTDVFSH